jgi:hypothetical protein
MNALCFSFPNFIWERNCPRNFIAAFLLAAPITLAACSRLTQPNLEKIHDGMSPNEVKAVLGAPDSTVIQSDYVNYDGPDSGPAYNAWIADDKAKHAKPPLKTIYNYRTSSTTIQIEFAWDKVAAERQF